MPVPKYKKRFMAYINRDAYNNVEGQIDPWAYHSLFVTWATGFGVMDYENMPTWMYLAPILTGVSALAAGSIVFISVMHYLQMYDINLITECGAYLVMMTYQLNVSVAFIKGRKNYHNLFRALKDDFHYVSTRGQKYREKFFENQRLTFKACVLLVIFNSFLGSCISLSACLAVVVIISGQEEGAQRPLMFPFWLFDYDLQTSPVYEAIFAISMWFTFCYTIVYNLIILFRSPVLVQSHVMWVRGITIKADIIIWNLEDLLGDILPAKTKQEEHHYAAVIKHRMREVIEVHHSMFRLLDDYAAVFKRCLLYEQMIASPLICLTAYCFAEKYEAGEAKPLLLFISFGVTVGVFLPNFLGNHLLEKVQSVSDACWDMPFWNAGPTIRPYLIVIMQMSMRPLPLVAPGFADISLKTYSTTISRAYSWFNMLRQADLNFN